MAMEFITSADGRGRVVMDRDEYDALVSARRHAGARPAGSQGSVDQWHGNRQASELQATFGFGPVRPSSSPLPNPYFLPAEPPR